MTSLMAALYRGPFLRAIAGSLFLALGAACSNGDSVGPSSEALPTDAPTAAPTDSTVAPTDSTVVPADSTVLPPIDSVPVDSTVTMPPVDSTLPPLPAESLVTSATSHPGIAYGVFAIKATQFGTIFNASVRAPGPTNIVSLLTESRGKNARIIIDLISRDSDVKNADGTFNLTKWKAKAAALKTANFTSFITDGTVLGLFLIDEPDDPRNWGGKMISPATVEAMAQYSKQLWPTMTTFIRAKPTYLTSYSTYRYLDAAWAQYASYHGDLTTWINAQVSAAKAKRLGLVVGLNALDGGTKASGIPGSSTGKYAMSASQLRSWGGTLLNQTYACGFILGWNYDPTYFGRSDITSATRDLSLKAKAHVKTSCQQ